LHPRRHISRRTHLLLALHVWVLATLILLLDKLLPLQRLLRLLTPRRSFGPYAGMDVDQVVAAVGRRLRRPRHMRRRACLRQSLMLYHFLRLAGSAAVFHVAVFPPSVDPQRLHAHSWVTVGEKCVSEPPATGAVEMLTYGVPAGREKPEAQKTASEACGDWTALPRRV